jgi:tripartite-type tricarboxylate transporter receptor subunit TctC
VRDPDLPDIPTMVELGQTEEARRLLGFYASAAEIGRSIVAPPALPQPIVAALRRAFDDMLRDPVFLDEARRSGIALKPMAGERLQELVLQVANFPRALLEKARHARERPK